MQALGIALEQNSSSNAHPLILLDETSMAFLRQKNVIDVSSIVIIIAGIDTSYPGL